MLPRLAERVPVGQNPLSNPEAWRVRATLKCGTKEKGVQTLDVLPLSLPRETAVMVQKSLEATQKRQTREERARATDLSPEAMETPDEKAVVVRNERRSQRRHTEGKSTLFH